MGETRTPLFRLRVVLSVTQSDTGTLKHLSEVKAIARVVAPRMQMHHADYKVCERSIKLIT